MSTEKFNIIFRDYPEQFHMSEKQRAKYWLSKDISRFSEKMKKDIELGFLTWKRLKNGQQALHDTVKGEFKLRNPKIAGTPKIKKITAQLLWESGHGSEWVRQKMRDYLHDWFVPGIVRQGFPEELYAPAGHFIHFEYIFYYPFAEKHNWSKYQDYLNHAFVYSKTFEDTLIELGILKDDNPKYVRGGYARYVDIMDVEGSQERRLEIKIHFCKNNERIS